MRLEFAALLSAEFVQHISSRNTMANLSSQGKLFVLLDCGHILCF